MFKFVPNKSFGQLLDISPKNFIFQKSFGSEDLLTSFEVVNAVRNVLIMLKNLLQMHLKLLKKRNSKHSRSNSWFDWKKIADKITRVSITTPQNNSETNWEEILRERYISPEKKPENYWWFKINIII